MPPVVLIYNTAAGGAHEQARTTALTALRSHTEVVEASVDHPDEISGILGRYPDHQPVAAGGDGTVHCLVEALVARGEAADRPIGVIPLGTGNDLARALDLPADPVEAARIAVTGEVRELDMLVDDNGGIAINAVHLGVGAEASQRSAPLKPVLRRFAYPVGSLLAGVRARGWPVRVEVDGEQVADGRRRVLMIGIGNGTSIGGGAPLAPHARLDDGRADVIVSFAIGPWQRVTYAVLLRRGAHLRHQQVRALRGGRVVVEVRGGPIPVNADGELGEPVRRRDWRVAPRAWRIRIAKP